MYFKLLIDGPFPDEQYALGALDGVRVVCALGGVDPVAAWRDHRAVADWYSSSGCQKNLASEAEWTGAEVWESALTSVRRALQLPDHVRVDIELVGSPQVPEQFGPDRHIWRAGTGFVKVDLATQLLTRRLEPGSPRCR